MPLSVPHWSQPRTVTLAESKSGVRVTCDPRDNVVYPGEAAWPPTGLRKKLCGSRWTGATPEDDRAPRRVDGKYCALQSLNSEDAVTWSVFGSLQCLPEETQLDVHRRLFEALELPPPARVPLVRFWRRVPHPEKPEATASGPELDAEIQSEDSLIIIEAKWNSKVDAKLGTKGDRDQIGLRVDYCADLGQREFPSIRNWVVLGIGRSPHAFEGLTDDRSSVRVRAMSWDQIVDWFPSPLRDELHRYFRWRDEHARRPRLGSTSLAGAAGHPQ